MRIRDATLADVPALVAIGREMHAESTFAPYVYDDATVFKLIVGLVEGAHGIALVLEAEDGEVCGGFIGIVWPHFFGPDLQASDLALFIRPSLRAGTAGLRLIKAYLRTAKTKGAAQIVLANSTGYQADRVASLFERAGFQRVGYVYTMNNKEVACA